MDRGDLQSSAPGRGRPADQAIPLPVLTRPSWPPVLPRPSWPACPGPPVRHNGLVDADVVVIGAGALGLSTALHCAMSGRSVVVVERHTAGSQASGRAAGLFKSVQADELRTWLARRSITKAATFADLPDEGSSGREVTRPDRLSCRAPQVLLGADPVGLGQPPGELSVDFAGGGQPERVHHVARGYRVDAHEARAVDPPGQD
jgi:glycine/D-amino acid oxidase-like deaminating enzyme